MPPRSTSARHADGSNLRPNPHQGSHAAQALSAFGRFCGMAHTQKPWTGLAVRAMCIPPRISSASSAKRTNKKSVLLLVCPRSTWVFCLMPLWLPGEACASWKNESMSGGRAGERHSPSSCHGRASLPYPPLPRSVSGDSVVTAQAARSFYVLCFWRRG